MKTEYLVIGFGKAGKTISGYLAKKGKKVVLVEKSKMMYGGTCINVGCIPSKALVTLAERRQYSNASSFDEAKKYFVESMAFKTKLTDTLRAKNYAMLNNLENVTVIDGEASFVSDHEVEVKTDNETLKIEAEKIVINTGSTPRLLDFEGSNNPKVMTSEGLLSIDYLPEHLVIIGGGYISLEFSSFFSSFGSKVTILEHADTFLPREDDDAAEEIRKVLAEKGIEILTGVNIQKIYDKDADTFVEYEVGGKVISIKADAILQATGRVPNTKALNLTNTSIKVNQRGGIIVDEHLRTSVNGVYAAGDCTGGAQFTYLSLDDFRILRDEFDGKTNPYVSTGRFLPYSVFIDPPFSRVGMSEKEAAAAGIDFVVNRMPTASIPKANVLQKKSGFLKAIIEKSSGKILGAQLFCEESHEMINIVKTVMDLNGTYEVLKNQIFTHPTMSESLNDLFNIKI